MVAGYSVHVSSAVASHAQPVPAGMRHVSVFWMHELPHALPTEQVMQQPLRQLPIGATGRLVVGL
jgi:hypothetical protein